MFVAGHRMVIWRGAFSWRYDLVKIVFTVAVPRAFNVRRNQAGTLVWAGPAAGFSSCQKRPPAIMLDDSAGNCCYVLLLAELEGISYTQRYTPLNLERSQEVYPRTSRACGRCTPTGMFPGFRGGVS